MTSLRWPPTCARRCCPRPPGARPTSAPRARFNAAPADEPSRPLWNADPMNLFVVVEGGDHHVSLLDGDKFEVISRFRQPLRAARRPQVHARWPLRVLRLARRLDHQVRPVAPARGGRGACRPEHAQRGGERRRPVGHGRQLPAAQRGAVRRRPEPARRPTPPPRSTAKQTSRVSAVYDATPRNSFVVALKDIPELWEISYNPKAEPIFDGLVHDYKMGEAIAKPGFLGVRRTPLDEPLDDFFFDQSYRNVLGATRPKTGRRRRHRAGGQPRRPPQDRRPADRRHAAPGLGHHLRVERQHGAGVAQPQRRRHRRDRHEDLEAGGDHPHARPRLLHAQPRKHAATPGPIR